MGLYDRGVEARTELILVRGLVRREAAMDQRLGIYGRRSVAVKETNCNGNRRSVEEVEGKKMSLTGSG